MTFVVASNNILGMLGLDRNGFDYNWTWISVCLSLAARRGRPNYTLLGLPLTGI